MENNYKIPKGLTYSFTSRDLDRNFFDTTDLRLITLYIMEALKFSEEKKCLKIIYQKENNKKPNNTIFSV